ncbi:TetR family transcriptional regulator protein [Rhizobium gallicum]|uniref:TetR family transcriptional regulator protein n=2 Tax=Rhizobium gallicum TaxID=56730 RepID=A0A1L5NM94_9HYPH|nr:TetR family transcriptional regulator protein [Rhizobium gallicum]
MRPKSRTGRPSKQDAEEAGNRIIETATRLFANSGFAGTSIEQVAATCGAGKDTIYRRFPSKVALFEAVVEDARCRAMKKLDGLKRGNGNPLEQLEQLLRSFLAINMEPELIALKRITFSEAVVSGKGGPIPSEPDPLMEMLVEAVQFAQAAGFLLQGDASFIASHLIHSLVSIPTSHAMLGGKDFDSAESLNAHFDAVWNWLLKGVATGSA